MNTVELATTTKTYTKLTLPDTWLGERDMGDVDNTKINLKDTMDDLVNA